MQVIKCKNIAVARRDRRGAVWCPDCEHYCLTDNEDKCQCCLAKIGSQKKLTELKKFDKILNHCSTIIDEYIANPCERDFEFGWPIRIGIITYYVSIKYLAEYRELPNLECDNRFEKFLETVKRECIVLPRYMYAIK